ncbi:MAG TPA: integrin, partial [Gammaproteobacteria bacterium]|nr:integrin [Gammaproteobacteria bacterium]
SSVALSGGMLAVGAPGEASSAKGIAGNQNDNSAASSGAAYVFERAAGAWQQRASIKASNAEAGDGFGSAVGLSRNWLAVTAPEEDASATGVGGAQGDNGKADSGATYLFARDGSGTWTQELFIKSANSDANDRFGRTVAFSPGGLIVGSPFEDSHTMANPASNTASASGAAYVFE